MTTKTGPRLPEIKFEFESGLIIENQECDSGLNFTQEFKS